VPLCEIAGKPASAAQVDRLTAELTELKEKNELDTSTIKELQARADPVPYMPELHAVPHTARVAGFSSALPHLHRDWAQAHPGHICTGLGSPRPHLHRDRAHRRMTPGFAWLMPLRLHCT
jgi:hypothetical protein